MGGFVIIKPGDNFSADNNSAESYPQVNLGKTHPMQYLFQNGSPISPAYNGLDKRRNH